MSILTCGIFQEVCQMTNFVRADANRQTTWHDKSATVVISRRGASVIDEFSVEFKRDAADMLLDFTATRSGEVLQTGNGIVEYCAFLKSQNALASWIDV